MSDASFLATMAPYAKQIAAATGLDCRLFLIQWAIESAWGTSAVASHNNFAGLENSAGKGCTVCDGVYTCCPTIADFAALYTAIITDATYASVRATRGQPLFNQCVALGKSPWACSHYGCTATTGCPVCANAGQNLWNLYVDQQSLFDSACGVVVSAPNPCLPNPCDAGCTCVPAGPTGSVAQCVNCPGGSSAPAAAYQTSGSNTALVIAALTGGAVLAGVAWRQHTGRSIPVPAGLHSLLQPRPSRS